MFQPMPDLTADQHEALRADIAANGVIVPIVVDQHGRVIDGHNRLAIATELGVDCPREVRSVVDDEQAVDLAVTLNCARRHLTREQVRQVIVSEAGRRPSDSDRAIARRVGCSPSTVAASRRPQVSNLDTGQMTGDRARELTEEIKAALQKARDHLMYLAIEGMSHKISTAEIITAYTTAIRSMEQEDGDDGDPTSTSVIRDYVYTPIIDWLLADDGAAESWREHGDGRVAPLTPQDRSRAPCDAGRLAARG